MSNDTSVIDLNERRDREQKAVQKRLRTALEEARSAAASAFFGALDSSVKPDTELRMVIGITYGDPTEGFTVNDALFFAPDAQLPVDDEHRFRVALGVMKAADEDAFERLLAGLDVVKLLAHLQEAADAGSAAAGAQLDLLLNKAAAQPAAGADPGDPGDPAPS